MVFLCLERRCVLFLFFFFSVADVCGGANMRVFFFCFDCVAAAFGSVTNFNRVMVHTERNGAVNFNFLSKNFYCTLQ